MAPRAEAVAPSKRASLSYKHAPRSLRRPQADEDAALEKHHVIVIGIGDQRIGLLVERLEGQQDTVIKAIQGPVDSVRGIAGATDIGDQDPVLVLDVSAFVEDAVRRREAA